MEGLVIFLVVCGLGAICGAGGLLLLHRFGGLPPTEK